MELAPKISLFIKEATERQTKKKMAKLTLKCQHKPKASN